MEKKYDVSEALQYVLFPDGNISDVEIEESDDEFDEFEKEDIDPEMISTLELEIEKDVEGHLEELPFQILSSSTIGVEDGASSSSTASEAGSSNATGKPEETTTEKRQKKSSKYRWRKKEIQPPNTEYTGEFSDPPNEMPTPYNYLKFFIDDACLEHIAMQTNAYALQKDGKEINLSRDDIEKFIGILLFTGIYKCPSYRMYWETSSRFSLIADVMPRNKFESLLKYIHFNDNCNMKKKDDPEYDPLFKIRPLLDSLKAKMYQLEPEEHHSIDEQIIPFKGRSFLKQYNKNKPHKWGFKVFTRAGVSGLIYDFEIYTGKNMKLKGNFGVSGNSVLRMVENLPENKSFKIYIDNWFSSVPLIEELKKRKFWSVSTIHSNRMSNCSLLDEQTLKKKGRGSFDFKSDASSGVTIVKWYDNKSVHLASSYCGVEPIGTCKRWSKPDRKHIDVKRPDIVAKYNKHMGGVDLSDMLIELYRVDIRSRKWYSRISSYCFDTAVVNGWLLYRIHLSQHGVKKYLPLKDFRCQIAHALTKAGKSGAKRRSRPSLETAASMPKRKKPDARPVDDIRYDNLGHRPAHSDKKQRCKLCPKGFTRTICTKCNVGLCFKQESNCFENFHVL